MKVFNDKLALIDSRMKSGKYSEVLALISAFTDVMKYADGDVKTKWLFVEEKKKLILAELKQTLKKQEIDEKRKIGAEKLLEKYRKELDILTKRVQENISLLENIEKAIGEHVVDYNIVVDEHKHFINQVFSKAKNVGDRKRDDIRKEERDLWVEQLDACLTLSNACST
jgi:chlorite dismutase